MIRHLKGLCKGQLSGVAILVMTLMNDDRISRLMIPSSTWPIPLGIGREEAVNIHLEKEHTILST
uniref:Putative ovule protein n=1 Tax=Solanum chacoense TaxID=4108 RepID=A0A0V0HI72_SOLCH